MNSKVIAAIAIPAVAVGIWMAWPQSAPIAAPASAAKAAAVTAKPATAVDESTAVAVELPLALEQKSIAAEMVGNGKDRLRVSILNKGTSLLKVTVPLGQVFESPEAATSTVVAVHNGSVLVEPGRTREVDIRTAALHSTGKVGKATFQLSFASVPKLEALLIKSQQHPELNPQALQTAVLVLTENLPLSAVAKFQMAGGGLPSRFNTDAFRVETNELIGALILLRELQVRESSIALTVNPQLRIEAMIDPATRPLAMRYYSIASEQEWEYWRKELLQGEPSTRHYALYGIARFYPDVALQMLPRWARETRTNPVYRLSAVQALADTQRAEALAILRQLAMDLGSGTELAKAATGAADYLDYQLAQLAESRNAVAFRNSRKAAAGDLAVANY